jgi:DNA (cytosine-5)-methyltransferase 1
MQSSNSPIHIDLFAGCGGISVGLHNAGWRGLFAIEKSPMAFQTLKHNLIDKKNHFNWPDWLPVKEHNIIDVLSQYSNELRQLNGQVDLIAGGPPCQGFSLAGRRNENDSRNKLVDSYIRFVDLVRPRALLFENVIGFTIGFKKGSSRGLAYSTYVEQKIKEIGYTVENKIVDFSEFGIPQRRRRFILVGIKEKNETSFFSKLSEMKTSFLRNKGLKEHTSLAEALSDLQKRNGTIKSKESPGYMEGVYGKAESSYQRWMRCQNVEVFPDSHRFAKHRNETVSRFNQILEKCPKNIALSEEFRLKFNLRKKSTIPLDGISSCPTLTTLPDDYIHYSEPRILTVREYARIQSFEDWFEFKAKYTTGGKNRKLDVPRYTQIGNAVPPLFAELSGVALKAIM